MTRLVVVTMIWLSAVATAATAVDSVELRPAATVSADEVRLADVAVVEPIEAAGELGAVDIGPAPLPGSSREFAAGYVRLRLRKAGVDLKGVAFRGAQRVTVTRAAPPTPPPPAATPDAPGSQSAAATPAAETVRPAAPEPAAAPPAEQVRRGSLVKLALRTGGLSVEALGELMTPCAVGQIGKFRVSETRAVVAAQLTSASTAEVIR